MGSSNRSYLCRIFGLFCRVWNNIQQQFFWHYLQQDSSIETGLFWWFSIKISCNFSTLGLRNSCVCVWFYNEIWNGDDFVMEVFCNILDSHEWKYDSWMKFLNKFYTKWSCSLNLISSPNWHTIWFQLKFVSKFVFEFEMHEWWMKLNFEKGLE